MKRILLEKLAELEHNQWMEWAANIMAHENISEKRRQRWLGLIRPYDALPEKQKLLDRRYARRVIKIVETMWG